MSIICAMRVGGETWLGSDTAAKAPGEELFNSSPKWVVNGKWAVGVSGDLRCQTLIEAKYEEILNGTPLEIGVNIRQALLDDGFEPARDKNDKGFQHFGQNCLLASQEALYSFDGTFGPALRREEFMADGSGWELAKGAYYAAKKLGVNSPDRVLHLAVEAAIAHDLSCGGETWIHRLGDPHGA